VGLGYAAVALELHFLKNKCGDQLTYINILFTVEDCPVGTFTFNDL
jgi:hypothetical protein